MTTVRLERPADADAIRAVVAAAYRLESDARRSEAAVVDALREADALAVSLVALEEGAIVGHVAFSRVAVGGRYEGWYGLGPIAVRPDRQGRGIGKALVREGLGRLKAADARGVVVAGDPDLFRTFGFRPIPELRLAGVPPEFFLALPLGGTVPEGDVAFHAAFDQPPGADDALPLRPPS